MTVTRIAEKADVLAHYPASYLATCFSDAVVDDDLLDQALLFASEELYSYLAGRVDLPDPIPGFVKRHVINMALYALSSTADVLTEHKTKLYSDALAWAKDYRKNYRAAGEATTADGEVPRPAKATIVSTRPDETRRRRIADLDEVF